MSSVMMSRTFGAPLGGTTCGAHQGVESVALSLITPPNSGGNGGSCFPSSEVVALGEPRTPVIFCSPILFSSTLGEISKKKFAVVRADYVLFGLARMSPSRYRHLHDFVREMESVLALGSADLTADG
jgi:hypothetical protein